MILEIAVFNLPSAILAANAGANRLELCDNANEGGTTPSYGTLKTIKEKINIPAYPIIRPRGGDFLYSDDEFSTMQQDILLCRQLGYEGVVIGLLNADATVDVERTTKLVQLAYPMEVTFHRAFDRTADPIQALQAIIQCGCQRILTSGQKPYAVDGQQLIKQLAEQADERIIIMPGSGVRSNNIKALADYTGAVELHSSAKKMLPSAMGITQATMNEQLETVSVDVEEIKAMQLLLTA